MKMTSSDFSVTLLTEQTPQEVFKAITNVRDWWSGFYSEEIKGSTQHLNDEFSFSAGGGAHFTKQKLVEVIPDQRVVWLITDCALSFIEDKEEWKGTKVIFDISRKDDKTQLIFTHEGLTPAGECYDSCAPAWSRYLQDKLLPLINTGNAAAALQD